MKFLINASNFFITQVINASSIDQPIYPDIGAHVLMWLWDRCCSTGSRAHPTVIFVSSDTKYLNLLQMLKARGYV